jgi:hypothetical protein
MAAKGGEGPPLGRFVEVIAGHPIDAFEGVTPIASLACSIQRL